MLTHAMERNRYSSMGVFSGSLQILRLSLGSPTSLGVAQQSGPLRRRCRTSAL